MTQINGRVRSAILIAAAAVLVAAVAVTVYRQYRPAQLSLLGTGAGYNEDYECFSW